MQTESASPLRFVEGRWNITYQHAAGATASRFFELLAQKAEIWGRRCPQCRRVLLPPRGFCERCFVETSDWIQARPEGQIEAFTIVYEPFEGLPAPPYAISYVRLAGVDTALANYVKGVDLRDPATALKKIRIGAPVRVVFKDKREGKITDFWYELA